MSVAYRILVAGDDHVGYAAKCRVHPASGLNMRVRDGYLALRDRVSMAIRLNVDAYLQTGDLFHRSHPQVGDIVWARQQLERLAHAGIPVIGNTGNHDASVDRGKSPATASVNDPDRHLRFVTNPYERFEPVPGLVIHVISHYGLAQTERLLPEPENGKINILTAHGAAMVPGHEVFHCVDSPGEQPLGLDLLTDDRFAAKMLGHYHGMDEIMPTVWYAGSSLRRGFSDPAGGRGALLVEIQSNGTVTVTPQYIDQRAQYDLPVINAAGLTGADVEERIRANLASVDLGDAIVRQTVTNCTTAVRRGIDQPALNDLAKDTLMWMPNFRRPEVSDGPVTDAVATSLRSAGSVDLPAMFTGFATAWAKDLDVPEETKAVVLTDGDRHLRAAVAEATGDFATPKAADPASETARPARRRTAAVDNRGERADGPVLPQDTSWLDGLRAPATAQPDEEDVA